MSTKKIYILSCYLLINVLFIGKYGLRQDLISPILLIAAYLLFVPGIYLIIIKFKNRLNTFSRFKKWLIFTGLLLSLLLFYIMVSVDKNQLNTDRWSAMTSAIGALLNLDYPYTAVDHMGGRSSNFPGLLLIGIPFYLLGNVGFLEIFTFLATILFLVKSKIMNHRKVLTLLLLLFSPAWWWEIVTGSDLMSNIILIILFMLIWHHKYPEDYFRKPVLLGILTAIFILTRGIVIIPLTIFLFKAFMDAPKVKKFQFTSSFLIAIILLALPVILLAPDTDTLIHYNPIVLQIRHMPYYIQMLTIASSFLLAIGAKHISIVFFRSFLVLSSFILLTLIISLWNYGLYESIVNSIFDISYLGMLIPFSIVTLVIPGYTYEKRSIQV